MASSISWENFSKQYLNYSEPDAISVIELSNGMDVSLIDHFDVNLSTVGRNTLKKYVFAKTLAYSQELYLTNEVAHQIFNHFKETVFSLKAEYSASNLYEKIKKPQLPKKFARLAAISTSILEKCLQPTYKKIAQEILEQSNHVQLAISEISRKPTQLDFFKLMSMELVAKKLAYLNLATGETVLIPFQGRMVKYVAEEIHLWMGMNAYGLRPAEADESTNPILIFSGTRLSIANRGSMATWASDFDFRGVGFTAYMSCSQKIQDWLKKAGGNVIITGHSLGGALSQYAAIDNASHYIAIGGASLVKEAITFSAPGISQDYGKRWKDLKSRKEHPKIYNFSHSEDRIPTLGQSYVGKNFKVICAIEATVNQGVREQRRIHRKLLFGRSIALIARIYPTRTMAIWKQRALCAIPFIFSIIMVFLGRVLFGLYTSKPYVSIFGPLRWAWRHWVTEKYVGKNLFT